MRRRRRRKTKRLPGLENDPGFRAATQVPCVLCGYAGADHLQKFSHPKHCAFHWMGSPVTRRAWLQQLALG